jgi:hypothetical protein
MVTRRMAANRANAQCSTGPRTSEGKARARLNALKHGLATLASSIPAFSPDIAQLARRMVGEHETDPILREAAIRVAEASLDVLRARAARTELMNQMVQSPDFMQPIPAAEAKPKVLLPYKAAPLSVRVKAVMNGTIDSLAKAETARLRQVLKAHEELQRIMKQRAEIQQRTQQHRDVWDQLDRLDRYERRALSRHRTAIRAFDQVRGMTQLK